MRFLRGFMDNDSVFGQLMTRCGILIAANLLFVLSLLPVVTAGAGYAALYFTLLTCLREKSCNPFSTFWQGFKSNFKQGTLSLLALAALGAVLWLEISWCDQFDGAMALFRYPLMAIGVAAVVLACYIFPVMAAFQVNFKQLLMDSVYFAVKRPVATVAMLIANIAPMTLTYLDRGNLPTYAFLWVLCGFSLVTMFNASLLLKSFAPYLAQEEEEEAPAEGHVQTEREVLEDMKKLGM
ncbi:MAG: YesL family protein [Clostridiales bacterium]|nr:YesL family protein [Clostridiales bacterium]